MAFCEEMIRRIASLCPPSPHAAAPVPQRCLTPTPQGPDSAHPCPCREIEARHHRLVVPASGTAPPRHTLKSLPRLAFFDKTPGTSFGCLYHPADTIALGFLFGVTRMTPQTRHQENSRKHKLIKF